MPYSYLRARFEMRFCFKNLFIFSASLNKGPESIQSTSTQTTETSGTSTQTAPRGRTGIALNKVSC